MTTQIFETRQGEENSVEIVRKGHGMLSPLLIGFVSDAGEFFFDTSGEQVMVHPEHLKELATVIESAVFAQCER